MRRLAEAWDGFWWTPISTAPLVALRIAVGVLALASALVLWPDVEPFFAATWLGAGGARAIVGGLAGKGIAEMIDPTAEDAYWRDNYASRPYVTSGATYDDYGPAYRYGVDAYTRYPDRKFEDVESELASDWNRAKGTSRLEWERAKAATRDSWQRVSDTIERAVPGDSDRDGK